MKVTIYGFLWGLVLCSAVQITTVAKLSAATTALYLFDDSERTPANPPSYPGAFTYFDEGPNHLDLVHTSYYGSTELSSDLPPVATHGASLSNVRGSPIDSPNPDNANFSIGATGQITIEFWYKSNLADTLRYVMSQDDYNYTGTGSGWSMHQNAPVDGKFGLRFFQADKFYGQFHYLDTAPIFTTGQWYHLAFTGNLATGDMKWYNGSTQIASSNGFTGMSIDPKTDFPLVLGTDSSPGRGFAGEFLMDDLRFSNTALLPGNGTGVNELAWNVSLSPDVVPIVGDLNQDGHVNAADIQAMMGALSDINGYKASHNNMSDTAFKSLADVNDDGSVTNADTQALLELLKSGAGSTQSVPEPSSIVLISLATAIGMVKVRRLRNRS